MRKLMPIDIQTYVRKILSRTATGKGRRPQYVTAYQIFRRLPAAIKSQLIAERGKPGGKNGNEFTAVSVVAMACKIMPDVHIRRLDTEGITFETGKNMVASPGYQVCAIYRLDSP